MMKPPPVKSAWTIYNLVKYQRSNQNTNINQRPLVKVGDHIARGDVVADGASTDMANWRWGRTCWSRSCALERLQLRRFDPDSERVVADDRFTSIHIEELSVVARDTKLGPEEITRDISNLSESQLGTSTSPASSTSALKSKRVTCWSARSRRRAKPS